MRKERRFVIKTPRNPCSYSHQDTKPPPPPSVDERRVSIRRKEMRQNSVAAVVWTTAAATPPQRIHRYHDATPASARARSSCNRASAGQTPCPDPELVRRTLCRRKELSRPGRCGAGACPSTAPSPRRPCCGGCPPRGGTSSALC
jgi:hypothetical protein